MQFWMPLSSSAMCVYLFSPAAYSRAPTRTYVQVAAVLRVRNPSRALGHDTRSDRQRFRTAAHTFGSTPRSTFAPAIVSHSLSLCTPDFSQPNSPSFLPTNAIVRRKGH
ncbi:hypothetical protein H4582DRAFT_1995383 [Lactarius indigo]|nr:hypothetical protein H4582DRAFT_1995383 [Lactarius indigo]